MNAEGIATIIAAVIIALLTAIVAWVLIAFVSLEPDPFAWSGALRLLLVSIVLIATGKFWEYQKGN